MFGLSQKRPRPADISRILDRLAGDDRDRREDFRWRLSGMSRDDVAELLQMVEAREVYVDVDEEHGDAYLLHADFSEPAAEDSPVYFEAQHAPMSRTTRQWMFLCIPLRCRAAAEGFLGDLAVQSRERRDAGWPRWRLFVVRIGSMVGATIRFRREAWRRKSKFEG